MKKITKKGNNYVIVNLELGGIARKQIIEVVLYEYT